MTKIEWYDQLLDKCEDFGFEISEFWDFIKIKTRTDTWFIPKISSGEDNEMGCILLLHQNTYLSSPKSNRLLPETHIQFNKKIEPRQLAFYFLNHQKKYLPKNIKKKGRNRNQSQNS